MVETLVSPCTANSNTQKPLREQGFLFIFDGDGILRPYRLFFISAILLRTPLSRK